MQEKSACFDQRAATTQLGDRWLRGLKDPEVAERSPLESRAASCVRYVNDAGSEIHLSSTDLAFPVASPKVGKLSHSFVCKIETSFGKSESSKARLGIPTILRWTPPLKLSVMDVELRYRHDRVLAIEGSFEALAGSGVIRRDEVVM
jgi:hypothetical protein